MIKMLIVLHLFMLFIFATNLTPRFVSYNFGFLLLWKQNLESLVISHTCFLKHKVLFEGFFLFFIFLYIYIQALRFEAECF